MSNAPDSVTFTREDLLRYLPVLKSLYECFDKQQIIDWMLKREVGELKECESEKTNEGYL